MTDLKAPLDRRNETADMLKGLAVLFMIQVHVMEQFATADTYNSVAGRLSLFLGGPPCAPVFLAVMGYFLAPSRRPGSYFIKRGILLFLGGIALNIGRSANLLFLIISGKSDLDPWFFILGVDILPLAGLSLILLAMMRFMFKEAALPYLILAIAMAAVGPVLYHVATGNMIADHVLAFLWGTAEWSYFPLFPWAAYVLAGYTFRLFMVKSLFFQAFDIQRNLLFLIPLLAVLAFTMTYGVNMAHTLDGPGGYYHHGLLFFWWVVLFMVVYLLIINFITKATRQHRVIRFIMWTGKKVTLLYVIQWLIIGNLATLLYRSQDLFQLAGWVVAVTFVTVVLGKIIARINFNRGKKTYRKKTLL